MNPSEISISRNIVDFCAFLRANHFQIGVQETLDVHRLLNIIPLQHRQTIQESLRALLCSSREEFEAFHALFEQFWNPSISLPRPSRPSEQTHSSVSPEGRLSRSSAKALHEVEADQTQTTGASAQERLRRMDFSKVPDDDLALLEEIAMKLWQQMSVRISRRWKSEGQEDRIDLRNTIRRNIGHGGELLDLKYNERKKKKLHLVALLDISGSMELYSSFLLRFLYALHRYFRKVDSFLFGTRLTPISNAMAKDQLPLVLSSISRNVEDWSGGTKIGDCLKEFNATYARKLLTRNTMVLILSDGWDTGSPGELAEEVGYVKQRVKKLIWLNPLLGHPDYQPLTRGMSAVLPFLDVFAPAHNIQSLLDLEKQWI